MKRFLMATAFAALAAPATAAETHRMCLTPNPDGSCACQQDVVIDGTTILWRWSRWGTGCPVNRSGGRVAITPTGPVVVPPDDNGGGGEPTGCAVSASEDCSETKDPVERERLRDEWRDTYGPRPELRDEEAK